MRIVIFLLINNLLFQSLLSQIDPANIDIVRDDYGVPHIFAKTDAEVAYGLAWAHAEDDFKTIQIGYLAGNNLLSRHIGNLGLGADFISQFIGSDSLFDQKYNFLCNYYHYIKVYYVQYENKILSFLLSHLVSLTIQSANQHFLLF